MQLLKRVFSYLQDHKAFFIYLVSSFVNKAIGILLLPIFTTYLSPSDYGQINIFSNILLLLTPVVSLGILQSVGTDYFKMSRKEFSSFLSTVIMLPVCISLFLLLLVLFGGEYLSSLLKIPFQFVFWVPVVVLGTFGTELYLILLRNEEKPARYAWFNILKTTAEILLSLLLVVIFSCGMWGRFTGILAGGILIYPVLFVYLKKSWSLSLSFDKKIVRAELLYAVPVIIHQFSISLFNTSDKFFISHFATMTDVGNYAIAYQLAFIVIILSSTFNTYFYPKIYALYASFTVAGERRVIRDYFYFLIFLAITSLAIYFLSGLFYSIFINQSFWAGKKFIGGLLIGNFMWAAATPLSTLFFFQKSKSVITFLALSLIVINLLLHFFFIRNMGVDGAPVSIAIFYTAAFLFTAVLFFFRYKKIKASLLTGSYNINTSV